MSNQSDSLESVVIGDGVVVKGTFTVPSKAIINGVIEGDLTAEEVLIGPTGKITGRVSAKVIDVLGQQIERSLHFFQSSQPQVSVKRLFLAGGCAVLAGVQQHLDSSNELSVSVVDPFVGMNLAIRATRANLGRDAPSLLVATGLALRSFD